MNQKSIVVFLHLKGLSARAKDVHTELVQVLGSDAIASSTVTKKIQDDVILQNEPEAEDMAEHQGFLITNNAILEAFEILLFPRICQIAKMAFIPPTTVFRRLAKSLRFVLKRLRCFPTNSGIFKDRLG
jgi:hypothetical protein